MGVEDVQKEVRGLTQLLVSLQKNSNSRDTIISSVHYHEMNIAKLHE